MTQAEIVRALHRLEESQKTFVPREVYERDLHELRGDIREIKGDVKKAMWGIIGLFCTVIVQVVVAVASRGFG